jgi:cell division protein FtsB
MLPGGSSSAPRAPFVVLVLLVLGFGLVGLLALNTALQQGSYALTELEAETTQLRDDATTLADEVAAREAPAELARRAQQLGMVQIDNPRFLVVDGAPGGAG